MDAVGKIRVFIADDHPVVRAGLKALIATDPGVEIVGETHDGRAAVRLATQLEPDVAVLDMSMPGMSGAQVADALRASCPQCRVLILTVHEDRAYLRELLDAGVAGYVLKRSAADELLRAIRAVAAGGTYLDPAIAAKAIGRAPQRTTENGLGQIAELSDREAGVLRLMAAGYSNKEISAQLSLSVKTVETYKARAMEKLGLRTRVEVVRYALSQGWLAV